MSGRASGRRRRLGVDGVLSGVLTLLVAGSLVLTGRLWLTNPYLTPPPPQPQNYVAPDADGRLAAAGLVVPVRLVVHGQSGAARALRDPADPAFRSLWSVAQSILKSLTPQTVAAGAASNPGAFAAAAVSGATLEMSFAVRLPWADWWDALAGGSGSGGPAVDKLLIVPGSTAPAVFLEGGTGVRRIAIPGGNVGPLAKELAALPATGDLLRALPAAVDGIAVLPGVLVTAEPLPPPFEVGVERLDANGLVGASFTDPSVVRRAIEDDGSSFYTDGEDWLRISPNGVVLWSAPGSAAAPAGGLDAALGEAAGFVDRRGGWPGSATLVGAGPAPGDAGPGGSPASGGYKLDFAPRYRGLLILGSPEAVEVSAGAAGVVSYLRHVPVPVGRMSGVGAIGPEQALADLASRWPAEMPRSPRLVSNAWECYVYFGGDRMDPAWVFELGDGEQVLVDASSEQVLAPLSGLP